MLGKEVLAVSAPSSWAFTATLLCLGKTCTVLSGLLSLNTAIQKGSSIKVGSEQVSVVGFSLEKGSLSLQRWVRWQRTSRSSLVEQQEVTLTLHFGCRDVLSPLASSTCC